jgi:GH15 family glucan-1,4-alpha-glucosidase
LQVAYDLHGRKCLEERELSHFEGYQGSRPVRIGNNACGQRQLDVYGNVILAAEGIVAAGGQLDRTESRMLAGFGRTVCKIWREPDSSMWEIRGPQRQYTVSKVMCWLALDRLLKLNEQGRISLGSLANRFRDERMAIADMIETRGFNRNPGSYTSELDGSQAEASLLLMGLLGYKEPNDPRMIATYELISRRLARNGLLYRYEPGYDGNASTEGTFGICTFWAVEYLAKRGEIEAAENMLDQACSYANDLGLFAEEIDPDTGASLGNFPQAFTHVGLINAALAVHRARQRP